MAPPPGPRSSHPHLPAPQVTSAACHHLPLPPAITTCCLTRSLLRLSQACVMQTRQASSQPWGLHDCRFPSLPRVREAPCGLSAPRSPLPFSARPPLSPLEAASGLWAFATPPSGRRSHAPIPPILGEALAPPLSLRPEACERQTLS